MHPDNWPVDTPAPDMLDQVRQRAAARRRARHARRTALAGFLTVAVVLSAGTLTATQSASDVRTTPADGSPVDSGASDVGAARDDGKPLPTDAVGRNRRGPAAAPGGDAAATPKPTLPSPPRTPGTTTTTAPAPAPDGGEIAFVRDGRIWLVGADGSGPGTLTSSSHQLADPDWAPDGRQLVAVSWRTDVTGMPVSRLAIVGLAGTVQPITGEGAYKAPKWSPDGSRIAFARNVAPSWTAPRYELWTVAPDGSNERRVAEEVGDAFSWSPDGRRLAAECPGSVCTMRADGGDVREVPGTSNHAAPAWSPDGTRLAVAMLDDRKIVTMDLDGTDRRTVAVAETTELDWSPDGTHLVYASVDADGAAPCSGCSRIWRVGIDGAGRRPLTDGAADYTPTWKPTAGA